MTTWAISFGDTFINELLNLPQAVQKRVSKITKVLRADPISAQGDAKKLKGYQNNIYRVRLGDYRLIYSFGEGWVQLLSIRKRDDRTYDLEVPEPDNLSTPPAAVVLTPQPESSPVPAYTHSPPPPSAQSATLPAEITTALPFELTHALLQQWQIPTDYWTDILNAASSEAILELSIPDRFISRILDNLYPRPIEEIQTQRQYVLTEPEDLDRVVEGTLTDFLLKLDPEQEKLLSFGSKGTMLVKGGPGTGKSTLALYRVKKLVEQGCRPILFTTYTNALVTYSEELLKQLLQQPPGDAGVKVSTVDSLAFSYYVRTYGKPEFAGIEDCLQLLKQSIATTDLPAANVFDRQVRRQSLERLGIAYLLQEILSVIESWGITQQADYLNLERHGRGFPLKANLRESIWAVYQTWLSLMEQQGLTTWEILRRKALTITAQLTEKPFQALLIDEAQDLSPVALRFLLSLVSSFEAVYLTADAAQSLYQRGFSWKQIHADLNVAGRRTLILRRNYRNTQQILAACTAILQDTQLVDNESLHQEPSAYLGDCPAILLLDDPKQEAQTIYDFFTTAAKRFRLPIHAGAILCTNQQAGRSLAKRLVNLGLKAEFVIGKKLDINSTAINVITLHSAKGLEFPWVAIVGLQQGQLPLIEADLLPEELPAVLDEQRRLFYVGCSRAMRALLVCGSKAQPSQFLTSLKEPHWQRSTVG
ncbi:MAG TPA: 3'-5' exonuclease [Coleofasciculaceae cyanobacterium]|jgi:superfamily I DNA/RNA helicase/mRNA-degrading endonuclease RelE of RelBE toxin-antitoxin system